MNDDKISFEVTKHTPQTRFLISLSDGRTVIQDNVPGQKHAWTRLGEWLKENKDTHITGMRLQKVGGDVITLPSNQDGYFFGNKQIGVWRGMRETCLGLGYFDGQMVNIMWYRQPNFDKVVEEQKTEIKAGFMLIRK